jgi:hypothetical protein
MEERNMKRAANTKRGWLMGMGLALGMMALAALGVTATAGAAGQDKDSGKNSAKAEPAATVMGTVEGLVRDISCPIQNKDAAATKFNIECVLECVRNGSPLIIQTREGVLYTPISDSIPDKDQRERLMPFVGKFVRVAGPVYERGGTHAIGVQQITEMKEVHLVTDAK